MITVFPLTWQTKWRNKKMSEKEHVLVLKLTELQSLMQSKAQWPRLHRAAKMLLPWHWMGQKRRLDFGAAGRGWEDASYCWCQPSHTMGKNLCFWVGNVSLNYWIHCRRDWMREGWRCVVVAGFQRESPGFSVSRGAPGFWAEAGPSAGCQCRNCPLGQDGSHDGFIWHTIASFHVVWREKYWRIYCGFVALPYQSYYWETKTPPLFGCQLSPEQRTDLTQPSLLQHPRGMGRHMQEEQMLPGPIHLHPQHLWGQQSPRTRKPGGSNKQWMSGG